MSTSPFLPRPNGPMRILDPITTPPLLVVYCTDNRDAGRLALSGDASSTHSLHHYQRHRSLASPFTNDGDASPTHLNPQPCHSSDDVLANFQLHPHHSETVQRWSYILFSMRTQQPGSHQPRRTGMVIEHPGFEFDHFELNAVFWVRNDVPKVSEGTSALVTQNIASSSQFPVAIELTTILPRRFSPPRLGL
ncbi:hypothetical protein BDN72DRAFT_904803 [Pluteus cervinus]|uniref:Uncharacterized protein n=1 Tax=Pluteus cervinus TaxID=181527 RepID=A0ACD3A4L7_9AGAR|nr:hypothetical protein BDN72DRAFT_904803 [Pluteus cervinus]